MFPLLWQCWPSEGTRCHTPVIHAAGGPGLQVNWVQGVGDRESHGGRMQLEKLRPLQWDMAHVSTPAESPDDPQCSQHWNAVYAPGNL